MARLAGVHGWSVAVNFQYDEAAAQGVVGQIRAQGGRAVAIQGDVAQEGDVLRLFETTERELGPLRGLVNNAGITGGFA